MHRLQKQTENLARVYTGAPRTLPCIRRCPPNTRLRRATLTVAKRDQKAAYGWALKGSWKKSYFFSRKYTWCVQLMRMHVAAKYSEMCYTQCFRCMNWRWLQNDSLLDAHYAFKDDQLSQVSLPCDMASDQLSPLTPYLWHPTAIVTLLAGISSRCIVDIARHTTAFTKVKAGHEPVSISHAPSRNDCTPQALTVQKALGTHMAI